METLTTALSTLSLNIIDSEHGAVQKGRKGSSSRLVRTYSNCSYTVVNTFRPTAECRATTLPAVRVKQTVVGGYPASYAAMPTFQPRFPLASTPLKRVTSSAPRNNPHPLGMSVRGMHSRDNKLYEWNHEAALTYGQIPRMLQCAEKTNRSCGKQNTQTLMETRPHVSCSTQEASAGGHTTSLPHQMLDHDKDMFMERRHPAGGKCNHPIRLHPPVGHKVASYV